MKYQWFIEDEKFLEKSACLLAGIVRLYVLFSRRHLRLTLTKRKHLIFEN